MPCHTGYRDVTGDSRRKGVHDVARLNIETIQHGVIGLAGLRFAEGDDGGLIQPPCVSGGIFAESRSTRASSRGRLAKKILNGGEDADGYASAKRRHSWEQPLCQYC